MVGAGGRGARLRRRGCRKRTALQRGPRGPTVDRARTDAPEQRCRRDNARVGVADDLQQSDPIGSLHLEGQVIDEQEHLLSLSKADLREFTVLKSTPMPSYKDKFSSQELADLEAYLLSLRGVK